MHTHQEFCHFHLLEKNLCLHLVSYIDWTDDPGHQAIPLFPRFGGALPGVASRSEDDK
jgi:hypothetical protein